MSKGRKSDKGREKDGRGVGRGINYKPWIKVHEFGSEGLASRLLGWKVPRIYQFMSKLERDYFMITQWDDNVIDIREQYPLKPQEDTLLIANEFGISHPAINRTKGKEIVMTSDFVITLKNEKLIYDIARTVKPVDKINERVAEKFKIEEVYWTRRLIDWKLATEKEINKIIARNLYFLYKHYFFDKHSGLDSESFSYYTALFIDKFIKNNYEVKKTTYEMDELLNWGDGMSLSLFKYMLAHKIIKVDISNDITQLMEKPNKYWI